MDMQSLSTLIGSLGFPIVMCLMLFWYMKEQLADHKAETDALRDAINELKLAITTLTERLDKNDK